MNKEFVSNRALEINPIFVVGTPRSGTTLVGKILNQHSRIHSPGESHFFEDVWTRKDELGSLMVPEEIAEVVPRVMTLFERYSFPEAQREVERYIDPENLVSQTLQLGGGYNGLYAAFMIPLASSVGKERFCDDTPKHLFYLPDILNLFPNAKFIGCIRDPRDFLHSYRNYWRRSDESERLKALYHPIITSTLWRSSVKLLLDYKQRYGDSRVLLVQYEKLVTEPEAEVQRISDFLEVDYQACMLAVETNNSSFEQKTPGIFPTSVGRWRSSLPPEDTWWCQIINKQYMNDLAIAREPINPSKLGLFNTLARTPFALFGALRANEEKRGPLLGYLVRRVRAILS